MDKQFRRFLCEVVFRPSIVALAFLLIVTLHRVGYYNFYLYHYKHYSVWVGMQIVFIFWYIMFPTLIILALLKSSWRKAHYSVVLVVVCGLLFWGGGDYAMLRFMLSMYWLAGSAFFLILKFFCLSRILRFFKAI
ncbi:hypothetical protein [Atlantibacter subterraneus]|uniref:hypothetical protein n=1 Tax=Atlantibacter subterraneus TaxID=255519 RepID=UPI00289E8965|nr:hypothetical protein [Atlantibacter subterranea]